MGGQASVGKCCERSSAQCMDSSDVQGEFHERKSIHAPGIDSWDKLDKSPASGSASNELTARSDHQDAVVTFKDGSAYEGQFLNGKRDGKGTWKSSTGQYSGQWKCDQQDGEGHQKWHDGRFYVGQFRTGNFDGQGRMEWHTPQGLMIFDGQYQLDRKHGRGKFIWPDGRIYDGEWAEGKRWGHGSYFNSKGEHKYGLWVNDKLERWTDGPEQKLT